MSLQLTHRPLEPELGVALVTSVNRPWVQIVEAQIPATEMQDQNDMAKLLEDLAQEVD